MLRAYFNLTKPGIIFGNLVTGAAGFALASRGHFDASLFFITMLGLACIIAAACICNNYIDREMDSKMARTKNRPLVTGIISVKYAFALATVFLLLGTYLLPFLPSLFALLGFFIYVFVYSPWKYVSWHATLIGSIAGGMPPVAGYAAASGTLDLGALLIFAIVVLWQMPHFFAISLYRIKDYAAASIPVLPLARGVRVAKLQTMLYMMAFAVVALLPTFMGLTGYAYLIAATLLTGGWIGSALKTWKTEGDQKWARRVFLHSLLVILGLSMMLCC